MTLPKRIEITVDEKTKVVRTADYVEAKTRQLKEFGYATLTREAVEEQLKKLLAGEQLSVIGMFMKDEVVVPAPTKDK